MHAAPKNSRKYKTRTQKNCKKCWYFFSSFTTRMKSENYEQKLKK